MHGPGRRRNIFTSGEFHAAKDAIDALSDKVGKTFKAGKNAINEEFSDKKH